MTDVSMDIAKFLSANETAPMTWLKMKSESATGNNLFVNDWPDTPDEACRLVRYEGGPPDETFSNELHTRHPRVQITIRGKLSNVILDRAEAIMKVLSVVKDQTINGTVYQRIKAVGEPFEIGPDKSNRQQAVLNVEASFYDSI